MTDAARRAGGVPQTLLLPGWHGSGHGHWQRTWESLRQYRLLEQADWTWPRRGDWMARLEEVVGDEAGSDFALVAHSLGCHLVTHWAMHSRFVSRVRCAMLVAPPELQTDSLPPQLAGWRPVAPARVPFPSLVVASSNDPYATIEHARGMAESWGSAFHDIGAAGHINAESDLGPWTAGLALLDDLVIEASSKPLHTSDAP